MSSDIIEYDAPSLQGKFPKLPADLPHGLIQPPQLVLEMIAEEGAKFPPEVWGPHEERIRNQWTLHYYFDYLGYEVVYRCTPQGPEVLAVGEDEIMARTGRRS